MYWCEKHIDELLAKFEFSILKGVSKENMIHIVQFLESEQVDYIEDIILNYYDLFLIEYPLFVNRYNRLKQKYGSQLVEKIAWNLDILEELFSDV